MQGGVRQLLVIYCYFIYKTSEWTFELTSLYDCFDDSSFELQLLSKCFIPNDSSQFNTFKLRHKSHKFRFIVDISISKTASLSCDVLIFCVSAERAALHPDSARF